MPVNKDAYFRYKVINDCLRNTMRKWQKKDLIDMINKKLEEKGTSIAGRQFNYDIIAMGTEFGAPIESRREGRQHFYYYSDPGFSIEEQRLSEDDLKLLQESVHLLQQIKGFSISQDIGAVVTRLESRIKTRESDTAAVIAFENPPEMLGIDNLGDIYQAILNKTVLRIAYKPYKAPEPQDQIIHPYFLKEFNNRWFLFGWNEEKERVDNMALDRMGIIKVVKKRYKVNDVFKPEEYFKDIVGVTRNNKDVIEEIKIRVAADRAPYVLSKPIHHSQTLIKTNKDGSIVLTFRLVVNKELIAQLLAFGGLLEVKEPEHLRIAMLEQFQLALRHYA